SEGSPVKIDAQELETVLKVISGAVSGFIGAAFFSDAKDPESGFWPQSVYLTTLTKVFSRYHGYEADIHRELYSLLNSRSLGLRVKARRFFEVLGPALQAGKYAETLDWESLRSAP
ncbi:MAG: hypothetical protein WBC93_03310, partial [Sulfitobacter sp.]